MKDLVFETLIAEASKQVTKLTRKGMGLEEAINEVANDMSLDSKELNELSIRKKKDFKPAPVVEDDSSDEVEEISLVEPNQIQFQTPDELDTAIGVLMYKGIPWIGKTADSVTFQTSDDMKKAHEALKRRWDFVNLENRTAAVLEFDNLEDYAKVLDFLASKNMTVLQGDVADLDDDIDLALEEAKAQHKKDSKDAKEAGLPAPTAVSQDLSYKALHKDKLVDPKSLDVLNEPNHRALRVVKRWK